MTWNLLAENTCGTCHARVVCFFPRQHYVQDREIKFKSSHSAVTFGYVSFCSRLAPPLLPSPYETFSQTDHVYRAVCAAVLVTRSYFRGRSPPRNVGVVRCVEEGRGSETFSRTRNISASIATYHIISLICTRV